MIRAVRDNVRGLLNAMVLVSEPSYGETFAQIVSKSGKITVVITESQIGGKPRD